MANNIPDLDSPTSADIDGLFRAIMFLAESQIEFGWAIANRLKIQNEILAKLAGVTIKEIDSQVVTSPDEKTGD